MARSKSSARWLQEHFGDKYVRRSQEDGYRSRASYKLLEIQNKDALIKPGMKVVDLGAAPGGWSQVAVELLKDSGRIVASDILPMDPIAGVDFIQGDFTEDHVLQKVLETIGSEEVDLVISDMAPNMSGSLAVDQPKAIYLAELALDLARQALKPNGTFLTKTFQGEGYQAFHGEMKTSFQKVMTRKPDSSRARSREVFLLGRHFRKG